MGNGKKRLDRWAVATATCYHPKPDRTYCWMTTARSSTASCGFYVRVRHGEFTCRVWQCGTGRASSTVGNKQVGNRWAKNKTAGEQRGSDWLGGSLRRCDGGASHQCHQGRQGTGAFCWHKPRGFSTKVHVRAFGLGKPMVFALTAGERHETTVFDALMAGGKVSA